MGRYGTTPFLFCLWGSGEVNQAFCRLSAVFGGTYILRCQAKRLLLEKESGDYRGILTSEGQVIRSKYLVGNLDHLGMWVKKEQARMISRAVCIVDGKLQDKGGITFSVIPPSTYNHPYPIYITQADSTTSTTVKDTCKFVSICYF